MLPNFDTDAVEVIFFIVTNEKVKILANENLDLK